MIAHTYIEPWQSGELLFGAPGLIGWILAVVWWCRNCSGIAPVVVQVICAMEVAVGALVALVIGVMANGEGPLITGSYDPIVQLADFVYTGKVFLILVALHALMMLVSAICAFFTWRRGATPMPAAPAPPSQTHP